MPAGKSKRGTETRFHPGGWLPNWICPKTGVVLEEYRFNRAQGDPGKFPGDWETAMLGLLDDPVWQAGKGRFVLLSNGDFSHFVKNACEVSQHVAIDPQKGTAKRGALFNLEAVPAEALCFDHMAKHLAHPDIAIAPGQDNRDKRMDFLSGKADSQVLKIATEEALAWLSYARRFEQSSENGGGDDSN